MLLSQDVALSLGAFEVGGSIQRLLQVQRFDDRFALEGNVDRDPLGGVLLQRQADRNPGHGTEGIGGCDIRRRCREQQRHRGGEPKRGQRTRHGAES